MTQVSQPRSARDVDATDLVAATVAAVAARHPELSDQALQLAFNFKRAATVLVKREEALLAASTNRTVAAVRALTLVWLFEPIEARDMAILSGSTRQAISGVLATLERDGLITKTRGSSPDRRLAPVSMTATGHEVLEAVLAQQNKVDAMFVSALTRHEQQQLVALTRKLVAGAGGHGSS